MFTSVCVCVIVVLVEVILLLLYCTPIISYLQIIIYTTVILIIYNTLTSALALNHKALRLAQVLVS